MVTKTFSAHVIDGQLRFEEPLSDLEGQRVQVTIVAVAAKPASGSRSEPDSAEPPEWMDIEQDVYFKMPWKVEILHNVKIVDGGRMRPTVILPEDLRDE